MLMRIVTLLRHGKTIDSTRRIFQSDDSQLSDLGRKQIESFLGIYKRDNVQVVITSPLLRAKESAVMVSNSLNSPIEESDLLAELKNPPAIRGKSYDDPRADGIYREWLASLTLSAGLRNETVENYIDMYERSERALDMLSNREENTILVVSHSEFIRSIITRIILGRTDNVSLIYSTIKSFKLNNARSVDIGFDTEKKVWKIIF